LTVPSPFTEFALLLMITAAVGALALRLRQPLIAAFIAVGPVGLGRVSSHDQVDLLATLGIALLLFVAGRKLGLQIIGTRRPGAQASWLRRVIVTTIIGYHVAIALAMSPWQEQFA